MCIVSGCKLYKKKFEIYKIRWAKKNEIINNILILLWLVDILQYNV